MKGQALQPKGQTYSVAEAEPQRKPACPKCGLLLMGTVCTACDIVYCNAEPVVRPESPGPCPHPFGAECPICHAAFDLGHCTERTAEQTAAAVDSPRRFYPPGPNGGVLITHDLPDGTQHILEWFIPYENPETGEHYEQMPAKLLLDVRDMCAILGARKAWVYERSAHWMSRADVPGVRVRTIEWMDDVFYDRANRIARERLDGPAIFKRRRSERRSDRKQAIRARHAAATCRRPACKRQHKAARPTRGKRT